MSGGRHGPPRARSPLARSSDTLRDIVNIHPLRDFRANFAQHQHQEWQSHYIDADAVAALLRESSGAEPPALALLEEEAAKAQLFCAAQVTQLGAALESLRREIDDIAQAEAAAGLDHGELEDERSLAKKRGWRLWLTAELLESYASLNCEAAARLAKSAEAHASDDAARSCAGDRWLEQSVATRALSRAAQDVAPHKRALRDVLAEHFFDGSAADAESYLRRVDWRTATRRTIFLAGFACGFCLCFAAGIWALLPNRVVWSIHFMFYAYRSAGLIALSLCLWAVNIVAFELRGVNHVFILQTSASRYLHPSEVGAVGAVWTVLLLLAFWLQASNRVLELHAEFQAPPICVWCCVAVAFVAPFGKQSGRFLWSTRAMLWRTIGRVLAAPFFPVRFRDVLVGDILTSMVVVGKDLVHFLCFLQADAFGSAVNSAFLNETAVLLASTDGCGCAKGQGWSMTERRCTVGAVEHHGGATEESECERMLAHSDLIMDSGNEHCKGYLGLDTLIALLPFWLRLLQCFRRHRDEAKAAAAKGQATSFTQLWNAAKYGTCIVVTLLSYGDHVAITSSPPPTGAATWEDAGWGARPYHAAWLFMVVVSTLYKLCEPESSLACVRAC